jgi:hypothetical protein
MTALEYQRRRLLRGDELPAEFFNRPRDRLAGLGLPGRLETSRLAALSSSTKHHAVVLIAERKEGKVVPPIRGPGLVDLNKLPRWLPSLLLRSMANKYSHRAAWLMWQTVTRDGPFTTELTPASLAAPRSDDPFGCA